MLLHTAEVPDTWEDLSISDIEEGGYFGDYVPSETGLYFRFTSLFSRD